MSPADQRTHSPLSLRLSPYATLDFILCYARLGSFNLVRARKRMLVQDLLQLASAQNGILSLVAEV